MAWYCAIIGEGESPRARCACFSDGAAAPPPVVESHIGQGYHTVCPTLGGAELVPSHSGGGRVTEALQANPSPF